MSKRAKKPKRPLQAKQKTAAGRLSSFIKKNKLKSLLLVFLILVTGVFSYNKYLDWRNVQDMKELLAAFEQLEKNVESETGKEFTIQANCGSVGKFATSYACTIRLDGDTNEQILNVIQRSSSSIDSKFKCGLLSEIGYKVDSATENGAACRPFTIRSSTKESAEKIFYEYDQSPGSPI